MTIENMKNILKEFVPKYHITKITLFGSRANNSNREDSDVDLIIEFSRPVSLIILSELKFEMEEALNLSVDIIHGPIKETDMIEVGKEIVLYAA